MTEEKLMEAQLRHFHEMEAARTLARGVAPYFDQILEAITDFTELSSTALCTKTPNPTECEAHSEGRHQ